MDGAVHGPGLKTGALRLAGAAAATLAAGPALAAALRCPDGPTWTRERQQRPPIVEPAPLVAARVEQVELATPLAADRPGRWTLDPKLTYVLVCTYAEGHESRVVVSDTARLVLRAR